MSEFNFNARFKDLIGNEPLAWQSRLFCEYFATEDLSRVNVIDLPTGLGKTMVMAIWLIAREVNHQLPRRLIYVVDRRTVVDQATELAIKLRDSFGKDKVEISTLRGQLADNREWSRDSSKPAIIIGTVDLIGSALLFSGYRTSYKRRPLEAGLLGQDSLLVLDEAHLSKPFEKLITSISFFQSGQGSPMKIIRMSATTVGDDSNRFKLEESDLVPEVLDRDGNKVRNPIVERFEAPKRLTLTTLGEKDKLNDKLAEAAIKLATDESVVGKRIVVFVRKPEDAKAITEAIRKHEATKAKPGFNFDSVETLTGTMRGLERDELVEKPVFTDRWLNGDLQPDGSANQQPVLLISTSAGEVGFDLNADHMVCDAAPIDSMIQRLGRVNRRGKGDATIQLLVETPKKKDKEDKPKKLEGLEFSIANTIDLLRAAMNGTDLLDVSPRNIAALKSSDGWKDKYADACSPEPTMVDLTDILLDTWSMTSITAPMPGRPDVAPWIRGIADELPQTTIAWRAELDLVSHDPSPEKALQAIFAKHLIRPHETVTTYSYRVSQFLKLITTAKKGLFTRPELGETRVALRMKRGQVVMRTIDQLNAEPGILNAEPTLILPHILGGLNSAGMLDAAPIPKRHVDGDPPLPSLDVADELGYEQRADAPARWRVTIRCDNSDQWSATALPGGMPIPAGLQLDEKYDRSAKLIDALTSNGLRIRLVQPIKFDNESAPTESLVLLSPVASKDKPENQSLSDHVGAVEAEAIRIANALGLADNAPVRIALLFAAKWHDEGKKADIWQKYANGPMPAGEPKGKSSKYRDPQSLKHTRHEFDSLLRIHHPDRYNTVDCILPSDEPVRDLALHLIATHHGSSRPHFNPAIYAGFVDQQRDALHTESIRRFARLQRTYGHWHLAWLENLLRCADALASADPEAGVDDDETEGGEQ